MTAAGGLRLGVIADDLTGGADVAGILAAAGARTRLVPGLPEAGLPDGAEAVVIALRSRTAPVAEAVAASLRALAALRAAGAVQILLKICSTFDSTPEGNIGPVAEALLAALGAPGALVCPAFPANGRTVYQGHLFVGDRLLSESGMERHPLTPMTDPDLRRWLGRQVRAPVGLLPLAELRAGGAGAGLARRFAAGERLVVADAVADADLRALADAARGHALLVGGSALAQGLPAGLGLARGGPRARERHGPATGPGLVLAGSCSAATRAQVAAHIAAGHPAHRLPAEGEPGAALAGAIAFLRAHRDRAPLLHSTAEPEEVAAAQALHGREALAARFEGLFAALAAAARSDGFARLVVAGGETAGAVAAALGPRAYAIGAEIAPGVPALWPVGAPGEGLVLKSGNFGGPGFFAEALAALARGE